jgi:hypothetical protein
MDPTVTAAAWRLASQAMAPMIKRLFVAEGPGAALVNRPVKVAGLVTFRGEKRTLTEKDLRRIANELVRHAAEQKGPHEAPSAEVRAELTDALAGALHSLGNLDMDDAQAVRLGPEELARRLTHPAGLSEAAESYYWPLLHACCLHILNFFTQRSSYVPRTLTEQTRQISRLVHTVEELAERLPSQRLADTVFETRYAEHIKRKHSELTIYGLDLQQSREWQLDTAYISLEATCPGEPDLSLPAERVLTGRDQVLLRGTAGSGKTTLVQWLALATARGQYTEHLGHLIGRVPFVLPLRRIVTDGTPPTPDRFLHAVRSSLAGDQPDGWAGRVLRGGRALLLVDGIDEIREAQREEIRRWIRELRADFPGNLWLVTARPSAVRADWLTGEGFTELSLSTMSVNDIALFVRRWHQAAGAAPELARALIDAIRGSTDLARLAVNPLMCGLLCALHRERQGFLPHGRKDLYEAALAMLLERRDTERAVRNDLRLSKDTQIVLLQKLAYWLIRNDRAEMDRADAQHQLKRALPAMAHVPADADQVLRHLLERSGLLREPAAGRVDFVHRTFQDYLAAKAAVEEGDFPLLLNNARNDQWEDVLRMAVALGRPAERERLLQGMLSLPPDAETEYETFVLDSDTHDGVLVRDLILAAVCLDHATEVSPGIRRKISTMVADRIPPAKIEMARELAEYGPRVLSLLPGPEGLSDEEAEAVMVTALLVATDAALPLIARYCDHPSLHVRRRIAWAWHRFDTGRYAEEVIARLDPAHLYFSVHSVEHAEALRALGGRPRVQLVGDRPMQLLRALDYPGLTHLWFRDELPRLNWEDWQRLVPELREIAIAPGVAPADIDVPLDITITTDPMSSYRQPLA